MTYSLYLNNELQRKTFKAVGMNAIWAQFNKYCKNHGCSEYLTAPQYLGQLAWHNETGDIYELR